ncbi:hypothetical protein FB446DRAFT_795209 [Lentinula raphanica]|nr:hypothetical protein FB446DRAFT_795209 [Lentinula raphanica]
MQALQQFSHRIQLLPIFPSFGVNPSRGLGAVTLLARAMRPEDIFRFILSSMQPVLHTCTYHFIMLGRSTDHYEIKRCSSHYKRILNRTSEYRLVFLPLITPTPSLDNKCRKCDHPRFPIYGHFTPTQCLRSPIRNLEFWSASTYLIFRTAYLRSAVFTNLGLSSDIFQGNLQSYASWLILPALDTTQPGHDAMFTNMSLVLYTYFLLKSRNEIPVPQHGLYIDEEDPWFRNGGGV